MNPGQYYVIIALKYSYYINIKTKTISFKMKMLFLGKHVISSLNLRAENAAGTSSHYRIRLKILDHPTPISMVLPIYILALYLV